ncbi:MAG: glycoside hydrolase family 88 protein [Bacteroidales bacterium]|nr:glycoside hydrolase family 88 protein [Bacteroidales bacterium]
MKKIMLSVLAGMALLSVMTACGPKEKLWSERMAESEMQRFPQLYQFDHGKRLFFGYTQGLGALAMWEMWQYTGDKKYYDYVYQWGDTIIGPEGQIHLFRPQEYNLDFINSGKILFDLYASTGEERFRMAMDTLMDKQMRHQLRTPEGGFWHKKRYTQQMWLDGLYMASPFLAEYGVTFNEPQWIDDVIHQLTLIGDRTYDEKSGLFYHAWDASHQQAWADPQTGRSPNFWGRSIGWYAMALVDDLDFIPVDHPRRGEVLDLVNKLAEGMLRWQDKETHLWYQVVDKGHLEGNYLESSVSSMMMYFYAKACNKGYLPREIYWPVANDILDGLIEHRIVENEDGSISLIKCCAVSGLGGNPYRDGSYEYYINERIRDNDGKATGPFILGCIELNR